jgi:MraZ protein
MYRGNQTATVDDKGRVKIPAEFLGELRASGSKFFVTSETGKYAIVYSMRAWSEIERKLSKLSRHNPARQKYSQRTAYYGAQVTLDAQGRLLLPQVLREEASLSGEAAVMGEQGILEIWNRAKLKEHLDRESMTAEDRATLEGAGL